jgi:hypothetical protein
MVIDSLSSCSVSVSEMSFEFLPHFFLGLVHALGYLHLIHTLMPLLVHQEVRLLMDARVHSLSHRHILSWRPSREPAIATYSHLVVMTLSIVAGAP